MKIVLADTDVATRAQIESFLGEMGLRPIHAVDGRQAWELLNEQSAPVLAILDSDIPPTNLNGVEVCRKLRHEDMYHYCYIILLSSHTAKLGMMVALENGADDFLSKPVNKDEFIARVQIGKRILEREEKLSQISGQWRNMLDRCPMGAVLVDSKGIVRRANQAFFEALGYDRTELLHKDAKQTVLRNGSYLGIIQEHGQANSTFEHQEVEFTCKNGESRQVSAYGRPLMLADGRGMVLFVDFARVLA